MMLPKDSHGMTQTSIITPVWYGTMGGHPSGNCKHILTSSAKYVTCHIATSDDWQQDMCRSACNNEHNLPNKWAINTVSISYCGESISFNFYFWTLYE